MGSSQRQTFSKVKEELSRPTTLALYDCQVLTIVAADASSYGLGAVLLLETKGMRRPVAYASRSMTDTKHRYAQIEKEMLAISLACEWFAGYILGKAIQVETDHKPLVTLLTSK